MEPKQSKAAAVICDGLWLLSEVLPSTVVGMNDPIAFSAF
jgi:hypothetical protein